MIGDEMQYHDHSDYDYASNMSTHAPAALEAMQELNQQAIYGSDNPIPAKYAELMALAVAFTTQCPYCIEKHTSLAKETEIGRASCRERGEVAVVDRTVKQQQ